MTASIWAPNGFSPEIVPFNYFEGTATAGQTDIDVSPFTALLDSQVQVFVAGSLLQTTGWSIAGSIITLTVPMTVGQTYRVDVYEASPTAEDELPSQTGNAGKFLSTDGSVPSWQDIPEELPDQTGQAGKYLSTDGTDPAWITLSSTVEAADVHFKLDSIAAIDTNLDLLSRSLVYAKAMFGLDNTGASNTQSSFQAALAATRNNGLPVNKGKILIIEPGTYKVNSTLVLGTDQCVCFMPGVIVDGSDPGFDMNTPLFSASTKFNVTLEGHFCKLVGPRAGVPAIFEGGNHGINFDNVKNGVIRNFRVFDFATDGIEIVGFSQYCENIIVENCFVNNCRRNAMSVISVKGLNVVGGIYANSNGFSSGPNVGIDIEPNLDCYIEGVTIKGVTTYNNVGGGIWFVPGALSSVGAASTNFTCTVSDWTSRSDGTGNVTNIAALQFINGGTLTNKLFGQCIVRDSTIFTPLGMGVSFWNWDADKAPAAVVDNVQVYDPDFSQLGGTNALRAAFVVYASSANAVTNLGNITISNCYAEDRRGVVWMTFGFLLAAQAAKIVKNVKFVDCTALNYTSTSKVDVNTDAAAMAVPAGNVRECKVIYTKPRLVAETGTRNISNSAGARIFANANALVFTIPASFQAPGLDYEVYTSGTVTAASITVDPVNAPGDRISLNGAAGLATITVPPGSCIRVSNGNSSQTIWSAAYTV